MLDGFGAVVERGDDRPIAVLDDVAAQFAGAGHLAVVGIKLLGQVDEPAHRQAGQKQLVDVAHDAGDEVVDLGALR